MNSPVDDPGSVAALLSAQAGRLMRDRTRQTWLVPLLAVPLSHVALSPRFPGDTLDYWLPGYDLAVMRREADTVAALAAAVAASSGTRALSDDEAYRLLEFSHDYVGLAYASLLSEPFLMVGMGAAPALPIEPRRRVAAEWVASGAVPVAMAVFIAARALSMMQHRPMFLLRFDGSHSTITRAVDRHLHHTGVSTWAAALALAHRYWSGAGWRDLGIWQARTLHLVDTDESIKTESDREREEMETQRRRHRVERKRLQQAAAQAQEELRHLRPLRSKVEGLRAGAERLRNREAELVQARDRAVARARALESANADLERECRESRLLLARLMPPAEPRLEPAISAGPSVVEKPEPPVTPLAGRSVFFFTGELRRSSAEATAQSLRALGADEIRTFCLRQGSDGPDVYPPEALVVVDIRFVGHSQSGRIEDRAARSGAQFLALRSGKGSLARTVARELAGRNGTK